MALEDRDYMRERHRTVWVDKKGRAEWFDPKNRGFDYQKRFGRRRSGQAVRMHPMQLWLVLLVLAGPLIGLYYEAKRSGWLPDSGTEVPFPSSGSVTVNRLIDPRSATSRLTVVTSDANAVAQLYTLAGDHVISLYVEKNDEVTTRVPPGTYRLRIAEGQRWQGPAKFFGSNMTFEEVAETMTFVDGGGAGINLHRQPYGNLPTRPKITTPSFGER